MEQTAVEVIGVGSPIMDYIVEVAEEELAALGSAKGGMTLVDTAAFTALLGQLSNPPTIAPGGSAANTTFALAHLGLSCAFLGKLGTDQHGVRYQTAFQQAGGACTRFKQEDGAATASCLSLVTPDSERTMHTDLGAAQRLSPADITAADFAACRHAHVEGYLLFNPELLSAVLDAAKAAGCRISLDLGSFQVVNAARETLPELLSRYIDVVFANEEEAAAFCGDRDPLAGLRALGACCETAVVKVGPQGAWVQNSVARHHIPALPVPVVRDTTGAGDLWAAGFLYGYLRGYPLDACGRLGALVSSHIIQQTGAALPPQRWQEIRADVQAIGPTQGVLHA